MRSLYFMGKNQNLLEYHWLDEIIVSNNALLEIDKVIEKFSRAMFKLNHEGFTNTSPKNTTQRTVWLCCRHGIKCKVPYMKYEVSYGRLYLVLGNPSGNILQFTLFLIPYFYSRYFPFQRNVYCWNFFDNFTNEAS